MSTKAVVLDANILIRAILGIRARTLILRHATAVDFYSPDLAYEEALTFLPALLRKKGADHKLAQVLLDGLQIFVKSVDLSRYAHLQDHAHQRISIRDAKDWPVLACAMTLNAPIWTEDQDFFGCGVATWTTDRIEQYFTV
jgi:predicted nucleic acid-binding protein